MKRMTSNEYNPCFNCNFYSSCSHIRENFPVCPERARYDRLAAIEDILGDEYELADVAPVRHGRWERRNTGLLDEDYAYVCSVCGEVWNLIDSTPEDNNMNYCPNCGALLDGKEDGHV